MKAFIDILGAMGISVPSQNRVESLRKKTNGNVVAQFQGQSGKWFQNNVTDVLLDDDPIHAALEDIVNKHVNYSYCYKHNWRVKSLKDSNVCTRTAYTHTIIIKLLKFLPLNV